MELHLGETFRETLHLFLQLGCSPQVFNIWSSVAQGAIAMRGIYKCFILQLPLLCFPHRVCSTIFSIIQPRPVYLKFVCVVLAGEQNNREIPASSLDIFNIWRPYLVYGILLVAYYCKFDGVPTTRSTNARPYRLVPSLSFMFISCQFTSFSYPKELPLHLFQREGLCATHTPL